MLQRKENDIVTKSNELMDATYRLSLQEQRIIAFLTAEIKPDDQDFKPYKFGINDFCDLLELPRDRYYSALKLATRKLLTRTLQIKKANSTLQLTWLSSAEYFEKQGYVELCFDPKLKPYLLQLKNCFTQYKIINVLRLRSKYAFRLYELLKQYQSLGKRKFSVSELREKLGLKSTELRQWIDFKRRVLEIAKREINAKTDLVIDYTTKKVGRRIEFIIFSIRAQSREQREQKNERYDELIKLVPEKFRGLKTLKNAIIKSLRKKGFEYVKRNIEYANLKAEKNYRAYLINALKEDWALGWQDDQLIEKQAEEKSLQAELQAKAKLNKQEIQIQKNKEKLKKLRAKLGI
jgi:plasmid replication initiation protein